MALIDYVDPQTTSGRVRELLDSGHEIFGRYSLFLRVLAHSPAVLEAKEQYFEALMAADGVDRGLKELAYVVVSLTNDCEYCASAHTQALIEQFGADRAVIEAIEGGTYDELGDRGAAVATFARQVADDPKRVSAEDIERLRSVGFDDAAVVELLVLCSEARGSNTIAEALGVHPDDDPAGVLDDYRPRA